MYHQIFTPSTLSLWTTQLLSFSPILILVFITWGSLLIFQFSFRKLLVESRWNFYIILAVWTLGIVFQSDLFPAMKAWKAIAGITLANFNRLIFDSMLVENKCRNRIIMANYALKLFSILPYSWVRWLYVLHLMRMDHCLLQLVMQEGTLKFTKHFLHFRIHGFDLGWWTRLRYFILGNFIWVGFRSRWSPFLFSLFLLF